jgi:hypothetical protein
VQLAEPYPVDGPLFGIGQLHGFEFSSLDRLLDRANVARTDLGCFSQLHEPVGWIYLRESSIAEF